MYERDDDRTIMLIMTENRDDMRMGSGLYLSGMHSIVVTGQVGNTGTVHFRIFVVGWYLSLFTSSEYLWLDGILTLFLLRRSKRPTFSYSRRLSAQREMSV